MHPVSPMPPVGPSPLGPTGGNLPPGTVRMSNRYVDAAGRFHTIRMSVPVNENGEITGKGWTCPKCHDTRWLGIKHTGIPVCPRDNRKMREAALRGAPLLPWSAIWRAVDAPLRAVWVGAGIGVAGVGVYEASVPGWALAAAAVPLGYGARFAAQRYWLAEQVQRGNVDPTDPTSGLRHRRRVARRARAVGVSTAAATAWTGAAAWLGTDPETATGAVTWLALVGLWVAPAATWWRHLRNQRNRPDPTPAPDGGPTSPINPDEAHVREVWARILARETTEVVGYDTKGKPITAKKSGKLPGTRLEDWHRVEGGWAATVVGPTGDYTSEMFLAARGAIASAFNMKASMVTIIPDEDDENRALVSTQRTPPIRQVVHWPGPDSIDVERGLAPIAMYSDGSHAMYELYRKGWGTPHDFLCGTTGSGKSEALSLLLLVDRWAHRAGPNGNRHGLVADLLIDPQQGQSYGPFVDDLAAPIACTLLEATLLVEALRREMLRRNRYLARVPWVDDKGRHRKGRKWWNPLVDGPIITLNIDEAHEFLSFKNFAGLVTSGARMYRKCGIRIRIATHTPLLGDLGGSMALRDMVTGGSVWVGRTANSLSGPVAFNGRLQVDPRTIPEIPGMAYLLSGVAPKPMLARSMWMPDFYDWVRDEQDRPIGYPAPLPPETVKAFGAQFVKWADTIRSGEEWAPDATTKPADDASSGTTAVDAVLAALAGATKPLDMNELDARLKAVGLTYSTRTVRDALKRLRDDKNPRVYSANGRHELTPQAREEIQQQNAEATEVEQ